MKTTSLTIRQAIYNGDVYTICFEEDAYLPSDRQSLMCISRPLFRNIGRPKPGMKLRVEQSDDGIFFYLDGQLLGSPKTWLSWPIEKCKEVIARQLEARKRVEAAKARLKRAEEAKKSEKRIARKARLALA